MARRLRQTVERARVERRKEAARRERRVRETVAEHGARVPFRVADTGEVLRHLVRLYPGPLAGLNEIVTNSADAYREAGIEGGCVFVRVRRRPPLRGRGRGLLASAARQADDLAGLVGRSQNYLPARL